MRGWLGLILFAAFFGMLAGMMCLMNGIDGAPRHVLAALGGGIGGVIHAHLFGSRNRR